MADLKAFAIQHSDGWSYEIRDGEAVVISQPYHPDKPGQQRMTEQEADQLASVVLQRLLPKPPEGELQTE